MATQQQKQISNLRQNLQMTTAALYIIVSLYIIYMYVCVFIDLCVCMYLCVCVYSQPPSSCSHLKPNSLHVKSCVFRITFYFLWSLSVIWNYVMCTQWMTWSEIKPCTKCLCRTAQDRAGWTQAGRRCGVTNIWFTSSRLCWLSDRKKGGEKRHASHCHHSCLFPWS